MSYSGHQPPQNNRPARQPQTRRSAGSQAGFAILYVLSVLGVSILLACVGWALANDLFSLNKEPKEVSVTISADDNFKDITRKLKDEGLIEYRALFSIFAAITNDKEKVVPGTFTLNTDMDYRALIKSMTANSAARSIVSVTIPEGYTLDQIFQLLEDNGVVADKQVLYDEAANWNYKFDFLQEIPLGDAKRLEGYLYPDTYEFYTPHDPRYAINKMMVRFDAVVTETMFEKAAERGYTMREILTIASMIEKETDGTDRERIASVIYNRLQNPGYETAGYLNIDAAIRYATGRPVTGDDTKNFDSPYNTYLYKGLTPTPIGNPGYESIVAALNPANEKYYYYALGDDGLHHYHKTLAEQSAFIASQDLYKK